MKPINEIASLVRRRIGVADSPKPTSRPQESINLNPQINPPSFVKRSLLLSWLYAATYGWKSLMANMLVVAYMSTIFWISFRKSDPWYEFFFYLTLQGWTLEMIYFWLSLALDIFSLARFPPSSLAIMFHKALAEVVFAVQVVVVIFFWAVVFPHERWRSALWELNCHGVGLLLIIGDYLIRTSQFSLRNHRFIIFFSVFYSMVYCFVLFYLEKTIYPGMDFQSTRSVLIFSGALSTLVMTHKLIYLVSKWKHIRQEFKTSLGLAHILFMRQNSYDLTVRNSWIRTASMTEGISDFPSPISLMADQPSPITPTESIGKNETAIGTASTEASLRL